jgi:TonB-dependent receptor
MSFKVFLTFLVSIFFTVAVSAQQVSVSGKVIEEGNNSPISGAVVELVEGGKKVVTDVEGRFFFKLDIGKKYSIKVSALGFSTKLVSEIVPESGANIDVLLTRAKAKELEGIVIRSSAKKESIASIYTAQRNSSSISDGISAEAIRRSPDKNTGDVLKRVSGASVQDNKFVIVRGLNERYNVSLLNNTVLPSTEADKKAFAFDIIPSSLIDNLVVYKTPTPDLPGDFSGGAIKVTTKDYPSKAINEFSFGISANSQTQFKDFYTTTNKGSLDALGLFDDKRELPSLYAPFKTSGIINLSPANKRTITNSFAQNYGYEPAMQSYPNFSANYNTGNTVVLKNNRKFGYIVSLGYSTSRRVNERIRSDYQLDKFFLYENVTDRYDQRNQLTGLANFTYSYKKSKISWKNMFNNEFSKAIELRKGLNNVNNPDIFNYKGMNSEASGNGLFNTVVEGLHTLNTKLKLDWNTSTGITYKHQPDQHLITFRTPNNSTAYYYINLGNENSPEIRNAGRVFSDLKEMIYGANANLTYDLRAAKYQQKIKFGVSNYYRDRAVNVTALGYAALDFRGATIIENKNASFNNIFNAANVDNYQLTLASISTNSTDYTANAMMNAGYAMFDGSVTEKFKITGGVRAERYNQQLLALNQAPVKLDNLDVLPSVLFTYAINSKANLRVAGSQSVNRPEFRELASYSVFDYENFMVIRGNPNLKRSKGTNADIRYELFPGTGEIISGSVFYKSFDSPIEQINSGNDVLSYTNATSANAYGAELEIRKRLDFLTGSFFKNIVFYSNLAYIEGSVKLPGSKDSEKNPLQGQSPYLINTGLTYTTKNDDLSFNLLYNKIGPRLKYRAVVGGAFNIYERPRDLIDLQISKKLFKEKAEMKFTVSDILAQPFAWYYKFDQNPKNMEFDPSTDKIINSAKLGTTVSLSLKVNLNK